MTRQLSDENQHPRVFISYSHDSLRQAERILAFANNLRGLGIDAWIDQYEPHPSEGWPLWMERQIENADFVIVICTERYYRRSRGEEIPGVGKGVAWESILIRNELYETPHSNLKFIPVLMEEADRKWLLPRMQGYTNYSLNQLQIESDIEFEKLYRRLTNQPANPAPELGIIKFLEGLTVPERKPSWAASTAAAPRLVAKFRELDGELCRFSDDDCPAYGIDLWVEDVPEETKSVVFEILDEGVRPNTWTIKRSKSAAREFLTNDINLWGDVAIFAKGIGDGPGNWKSTVRLIDALNQFYANQSTGIEIKRALKQFREN